MSECYLATNCNKKDCGKDFCFRKYKMDSLYSAALMTENQKRHIILKVDQDGTDLEQFKQLSAIEQDIVNFVKDGKNLYLYSAVCGNGKTSWAIRLVEAYFNKIWSRSNSNCHALFISVPRFLLAIKDNISIKSSYVDYIKEHIFEADIVVWDDIATKVSSEFETSHLLNIIDNRLALNKSNIYTSNLNGQQLGVALGDRLKSRVANMSINIELKGSDKRILTLGG